MKCPWCQDTLNAATALWVDDEATGFCDTHCYRLELGASYRDIGDGRPAGPDFKAIDSAVSRAIRLNTP